MKNYLAICRASARVSHMNTTGTMTIYREINDEEVTLTLDISGDYTEGFAGDNETPPEAATVDDIIATDEDTGEEITLTKDEHDSAHEILIDAVE